MKYYVFYTFREQNYVSDALTFEQAIKFYRTLKRMSKYYSNFEIRMQEI